MKEGAGGRDGREREREIDLFKIVDCDYISYKKCQVTTQTLLYNINTCSHYGFSFCDPHQCTLDTTIMHACMWKLKLCTVMCTEWSFVHRPEFAN